MKVGDHILAIGDVNLKGMTSEQVAHVLRSQTGPSVRMILARPIDPQSVTSDDTPGCAIIPTRMLPDMAEVRRRLVLAAAIQPPEVTAYILQFTRCMVPSLSPHYIPISSHVPGRGNSCSYSSLLVSLQTASYKVTPAK